MDGKSGLRCRKKWWAYKIQGEKIDGGEVKMFRVLSLGAGVQSSTLALLGDYDIAIFADTGDEPQVVYDWLYGFLIPEVEKQGKRVVVTSRGVLSEEALKRASGEATRWSSIPMFVKNADGSQGKLFRHCTTDYKITMIKRAVKAEFGLSSRQRMKETVEMLIGISTDEIERVKPSRDKWIVNRHPLITDYNMSRQHCLAWLWENYRRVPPKSSCVFCPYHNNSYWQTMKERSPKEFDRACNFDDSMRNIPSVNGECYLHRSMKPLREVDFGADIDIELFGEECEGMCGV